MKNKIIFLRKEGINKYRKIGDKKFKEIEEEEGELINFKKHSIPIPPKDTYTLNTGKENILFYDLDNEQYITFEKTDLGLSTEWLDKLFNRKLIQQLARAIKQSIGEEKKTMDLVKTVILYAVIFGLGYLIGQGQVV